MELNRSIVVDYFSWAEFDENLMEMCVYFDLEETEASSQTFQNFDEHIFLSTNYIYMCVVH